MSSKQSSYMPQLDAIRAVAIFLVMIQHWAPALLKIAPWGGIGVRCFFVLSGFLITGILLRGRDLIDSERSTLGFQMRQFYIRRSLRIFPIYFLTLGIGFLAGMELIRESIGWQVSYLSNFYIAMRGEWQGYVSHLWSLSVEEQFYLLWPVLILMVPRRWFLRLFVATIAIAPIVRGALASAYDPDSLAIRVLLPCCLDSLVMGAVLALGAERLGGIRNVPVPLLRRIAVLSMAAMLGIRALHFFHIAPILTVALSPTVEAAFFVTIIGAAARGFSGPIGRVLDNGFLRYTGRISYGLYLYHMFAKYVAAAVAPKLGLSFPAEPGLLQFTILFAMSYAAAALSAYFIERPFNDLKRHFPTDARRRTASPAPTPELAATLP